MTTSQLLQDALDNMRRENPQAVENAEKLCAAILWQREEERKSKERLAEMDAELAQKEEESALSDCHASPEDGCRCVSCKQEKEINENWTDTTEHITKMDDVDGNSRAYDSFSCSWAESYYL